MKRAAIITLFHKNYNFGGQLQAYALQKKIASLGYECKVIDLEKHNKYKKIMVYSPIEIMRRFVRKIKLRIHSVVNVNLKEGLKKKEVLFDKFSSEIPHILLKSSALAPLQEAGEFDYFITGSDQVWSRESLCVSSIYMLNGANGHKISYAASSYNAQFTKKQRRDLKDSLHEFRAVSVREDGLADVLKTITDREVKTVLDPTFFWSEGAWTKIANEPALNEKYAFVYLVFPNNLVRRNIYYYCKKHNLKMVIVPHAQGWYKAADEKYYDIQALGIGPREWLGYIKNAEIIFTDSFHGTIFSILFHKNFWSFEKYSKDEKKNKSLRKYSILNKLSLKERCVPYSFNFLDADSVKTINYEAADSILQELRKESEKFLIEALR